MQMTEYKRLDTFDNVYKVLTEFDICFPHLKEKVSDYESFAEKLLKYANVYIQINKGVTSGLSVFYANDTIGRTGYITLIGVQPEFQGQKLGGQLLRFSEAVMMQQGMKKIRLEVDNDNEGAFKFYWNAGYGREKEASATSCYMVKNLSE